MTTFATLCRDLATHGHPVVRAAPRSATHLLLELREGDDRVPAQWHADPHTSRRVHADTERGRPGTVHRLDEHLLTQHGGADRRLLALASVLERPGAQLVSHRPERRAVVRHRAGSGPPGPAPRTAYTKVVRPGRAAPLARTLQRLAAAGHPVPAVLAVDDTAGWLTTAALPGVSLHAGWRRRDATGLMPAAGRRVGEVLRRLHAQPALEDGATHDRSAELAVSRRALDLAAAYDALPVPHAEALSRLDRAAACLRGAPVTAPALLHRDLHDKQVVVGDGAVALLDLDTCAVGEAALDLANLLVHLELRAWQGLASPTLVRDVAAAVLDGYAPGDDVRRGLRGYALAARLRLLAVYAFRPASTGAAVHLVTDPLLEELG